MKVYHYVSFVISLTFVVTGILILSNAFDSRAYFANGFFRYMFGGILVAYGLFRAYNSYIKVTAKKKVYHYWNEENEDPL